MSAATPTIIVVEDEVRIRRFIKLALEAEALEVFEADSVSRGLIEVGTRQPDLVVLDLGLPDGDGIDLIREVRTWSEIPIIVLSARTAEAEKVAALDAGADDYLVKPFDPAELAARLRVLQRRGSDPTQALRCVGGITLDLPARCATLAGRRVELTAREWALVESLALRAGRIVAKADLERLLLGADADVQSNALEVHVSSVRRKLGRELIETVRGLGYRMPGPT